MVNADIEYKKLLNIIKVFGDKVFTRNAETYSHFDLPNVTFDRFPLVTLRKTAWGKAIREMEWFLSGDVECPAELLDWWKGQLHESNKLYSGYGAQLRAYIDYGSSETGEYFDQVKFILDSLKTNSNSRRLLMSIWNPGEMSRITDTNKNPNTPTVCHSVVVQFFVRNGKLSMKTYARSQDMLLGTQHNWVQSWAMLLYFAHHSGLEVGTMTWMWGDAHIYNEESHIEACRQLMSFEPEEHKVELYYNPQDLEYDSAGVPIFRAKDFYITGEIPEPKVTIRPKLL